MSASNVKIRYSWRFEEKFLGGMIKSTRSATVFRITASIITKLEKKSSPPVRVGLLVSLYLN